MSNPLQLDEFCTWLSSIIDRPVDAEDRFVEDLALDSITLYEVLMELDAQGAEIPEDALGPELRVRELYLSYLAHLA